MHCYFLTWPLGIRANFTVAHGPDGDLHQGTRSSVSEVSKKHDKVWEIEIE